MLKAGKKKMLNAKHFTTLQQSGPSDKEHVVLVDKLLKLF